MLPCPYRTLPPLPGGPCPRCGTVPRITLYKHAVPLFHAAAGLCDCIDFVAFLTVKK